MCPVRDSFGRFDTWVCALLAMLVAEWQAGMRVADAIQSWAVAPVHHRLHHHHRSASKSSFSASMGKRMVSGALREVLKATRR